MPVPSYSSDYVIPCARSILERVNQIRSDRGLDTISTHRALCRAAEHHAGKMSEQLAPFSHENALSRINDAGAFEGCGENLARLENYSLEAVPEAAVDGWVHSPGHYRNMLMPDFNVCGIGIGTFYKPRQPDEARESVTFVTMLFGIEHEQPKDRKSALLEKMDATICSCGILGAALGGPMTGGMLGVAAGSMLHKAVGITPKGTAFCIKEFTKRELLGMGRQKCEICAEVRAKYELNDRAYCQGCWDENAGDHFNSADDATFLIL